MQNAENCGPTHHMACNCREEKFRRMEEGLKIAEEALEFYAHGGNFQGDVWEHPKLGFFTGKRARETLARIRGEQ